MSKQKPKSDNFRDRFWSWIHANEKVIWVLLLALLSFSFAFPAFQGFSSGSEGGAVQATYFGREVTQQEIEALKVSLGGVLALGAPLFYEERFAGFPSPKYSTFGPGTRPDDFLLYVAAADRLGLRVSDAELGDARREIYYHSLATERAAVQLQAQGIEPPAGNDFSKNQEYSMLVKAKVAEIRAKLEVAEAFNADEWRRLLKRVSGRSVYEFEENLRSALGVAKLDTYIRSTVHVTPQEAYDRFRNVEQRRAASWLRVEEPEGLRESVRKGVTESDLRQLYDRAPDGFARKLSVRFEYLRAERKSFEAEIEKEVTDQDLAKAYRDNLALYLKPSVRGDDSVFQLLTAEEKLARDKVIYQPFDEVKDVVRERLIGERVAAKLRDVAAEVKKRCYPPLAAGVNKPDQKPAAPAVSFEALKKEFPFLEHGKTDFAQREEAEEKFQPVYDRLMMSSWFTDPSARKLRDADLKRLQDAQFQRDPAPKDSPMQQSPEKSFVFYGNVEVSPDHRPKFDEARPWVEEAIVKERTLALLKTALRAEVERIHTAARSEAGSDAAKFAALTAAAFAERREKEFEVTVASGEKLKARGVDFASTLGHLKRRTLGGSIMVPKKQEANLSTAATSEDWPPPQEVHKGSTAILDTLFVLAGSGELGVAVDDTGKGACYLLRLDSVVSPDPGDFAASRETIESSIYGEKATAHFVRWKIRLRQEAAGV